MTLKRHRVASGHMLLLGLGFAGIQIMWAVQNGNITPLLLRLGIPPRWVSVAWLAGPISGLVVQPIIGSLSDRYDSWLGRRRPFVLSGGLLSMSLALLMANARSIGVFMGDTPGSTHNAAVCAVLCFWGLDFSINGGMIFSAVLCVGYLLAAYLVQTERRASTAKHGSQAKPASTQTSTGWKWYQIAFVLHAVAWYMQIHPGHAIYEGVKPALLDSFGQALTVAPLFAFYEGLWFLGYAGPLQAKVLSLVAAHRTQMCAQNSAYPFCTSDM